MNQRPYTLSEDFVVGEHTFNKDSMYHGTDVGTYIMICTIHGNALVPKNIAHVPKLQCQGWEGTCDSQEAWRAHMNTQYINEEQNYNTLCPECWKACDEHWKEMWRDYYNNCM